MPGIVSPHENPCPWRSGALVEICVARFFFPYSLLFFLQLALSGRHVYDIVVKEAPRPISMKNRTGLD
jgi:hypothetical protein